MSTKIKVEFAGQSKTVVPKIQIESDEMSDEDILAKAESLYARAEESALTFAKNRAAKF